MEKRTERFRRKTGVAESDYDVLSGLPLFGSLSRDELHTLLADSWVQHIPRNTVIFLEEEPATRFYVIFDGWVKLFRETEAGQESVIAVFARGESFAEAAIFGRGLYPVSAEVVEDSRLLVIPADSFIRNFQENMDYALNVMASMSRHLHRLVMEIERLSVKSSTERVADFLVRLCPRDEGSVMIRLPFDKSLIAGRLGMQPETFSRSLARLRTIGIEVHGSDVTIPDIQALHDVSTGRMSCAPARVE
jgi:CRP-like cAMP-binding protein